MKKVAFGLVALLVLSGGYLIWSGGGLNSLTVQQADEESGPVGQPTDAGNLLSETTRTIVGTWKNTDDSDDVRIFQADGGILEEYNGVESGKGAWSVFTGSNPQGEYPLEEGKVYLAILVGDTPQYFRVEGISSRILELSYLDKDEGLTFKRIK